MKLLLHLLAALALAAVLPGCLERTDADLPSTARQTAGLVREWRLAGKFGGQAQVETESSDPWEVRYKPGGFTHIAGVCATDREVWVCDLAISRIQVFDFSGRFLRQYGAGMPLQGTLPTDEELYQEYAPGRKPPYWEDGPGQRWIGKEGVYFRAADLQVTPSGFWVADQMHSSGRPSAKRKSGVYFVPFDGGPVTRIENEKLIWPTYLALKGTKMAVTVPECNVLYLIEPQKPSQAGRPIGPADPSFVNVMKLRLFYMESPNYNNLYRYATGADSKPGSFSHLFGAALAFEKVVACDAGNRRLQVFDASGDQFGQYYGQLLRIIGARAADGSLRFDAPLDIDIADSGQIYLLDGERMEVAMLTSDFHRIGRFAEKDLVEPKAIDLSNDGRHCFITDTRNNMVLHYEAHD